MKTTLLLPIFLIGFTGCSALYSNVDCTDEESKDLLMELIEPQIKDLTNTLADIFADDSIPRSQFDLDLELRNVYMESEDTSSKSSVCIGTIVYSNPFEDEEVEVNTRYKTIQDDDLLRLQILKFEPEI